MWTCTECGYTNSITEDYALSEDEAEIEMSFQTECPRCGGHMRIGEGYAKTVYVCEDCGTEAQYDEHGLLWYED